MKNSRHKLKLGNFFGVLFLGALFFFLAPLTIAVTEAEGIAESLLETGGFEAKGQAREVLENLSPAQRQEAFEKFSTREQNQKTEFPATEKRDSLDKKKPSSQRSDTENKNLESDLQNAPRQAIYDLFPPGITLFGHDLFVNAPNSFIPETNIPIPADYRLGPGDSILIQLSGKLFKQHSMVVDREGIITFPGIGPLPVMGMNFQTLKEMLQERVQKQMLGTEVARVTLEALRSLQVFILGDVPHPGSYTVNSMTTATNAIFSSGGIKPIGSLRNIRVKRQGRTIVNLDLYDLLLRGDQSKDIRLQSGDIIFVPPIGTVVAVTGRVKRPGIYETLEERTVEASIALAGGLLPDADPVHTKIDRFKSRKKRILLDLDITKPKQLRSNIQSGDTIHIPTVPKAKANIVTLSGAVANPGEYQWYKGLHLTDIVLFPKLLPQVDLSYAIITRLDTKTGRLLPLTLNLGRAIEDPSSPDNSVLQPGDAIQIFGLAENRAGSVKTLVNHLQEQARYDHRQQVVNLAGYVRFPGSYPFSPGMGLKDLLHAAGDIKVGTDMEYTLVVRSDKQGTIKPFSVHLSKILSTQNTDEDIPLYPMDQILVFPIETTQNWDAAARNTAKATKEMIENKYTAKTPSMRKTLLEPILAKLRHQGLSSSPTKIVLINGSVRSPGEYPLEANMRISDLIRAGGGTAEPAYTLDAEMSRFFVTQKQHRQISHETVDLEKIIQGNMSVDVLLQPHDALLIKRTPQWSAVKGVTIEGEVNFPGTYPIKPGETLLQVLERAGGLTIYAYPEGSVFLRKNLREREKKEVETLASRLEMELAGENLQSMNKEKESFATSSILSGLILKLRRTAPQGRLAIDLPLILANASKEDISNEIVMRDQDHLIIPQKINEITVIGEVFYPTSHQYLTKNSIENYVNLSGGYSQIADKEHIYVVKASGQVISNTPTFNMFGTAWLSGGSNSLPLSPGDTIVVPIKVERIAPLAFWKDITQILYNIAVTSATLKTVGAM